MKPTLLQHNLPTNPDMARSARLQSSFRWGNYEVRDDSLQKFKALLEEDLGKPLKWDDDELHIMLRDMVHAFATLLAGPRPPAT